MKKGLVLCGGGSKGAYEMGAWRALNELGMKFDIVTGTSIGCLNAAMYAQHEYERCLDLWNKIEVGMIMESGFNFDNTSIKSELRKKNDMLKFFGKYVSNMGTDIKPFLKLLDEYIDEDKIKNSDIKLGICCAKFPSMKGVEILASSELEDGLIKKYILASASCFPIFPVCKIDKENYIDGGYYDNLPINFCIDLGASDLTVIDLSPTITHEEFIHKPFVNYIHPRRSLGSFMLFDQKVIQENIQMGYNDTMKYFNKYDGYLYTFSKIDYDNKMFRNYTLQLARLSGYIRKNKLKSKVSSDNGGDLFTILEALSDFKQMNDFDYLLRSLEIAAEILSLDDIKVYEFKAFHKEIIDRLFSFKLNLSLMDGYEILNNNKKKDYLFKLNDKELLHYLVDRDFGNFEISNDLMINLALAKPRVFLGFYAISYLDKVGRLK